MEFNYPIAEGFIPLQTGMIDHKSLSRKEKREFIKAKESPCEKNIRQYFPDSIEWINFDSAQLLLYTYDSALLEFSGRHRNYYVFTCPVYSKNKAIIHLIVARGSWTTFLFRKEKDEWVIDQEIVPKYWPM